MVAGRVRLRPNRGFPLGLAQQCHPPSSPIPEERRKLEKRRSLRERTQAGSLCYATLAFRTVERSPRAVPGAIAVHPARDATALV